MKTEKSKQLIGQALQAMPQDFSLRDARYHISRALAEIHKVEKKKVKQQTVVTPRQQWDFDLKNGKLISPGMNERQTIDYINKIDDLIAAEQSKIDAADKPHKDLLTD